MFNTTSFKTFALSAALIVTSFGIVAPSVKAEEIAMNNTNATVQESLNYLENGKTHFNNKDYNKALDQLTKAIVTNPHNPEAYYYRAITLLVVGNKQLAKVDLIQATCSAAKANNIAIYNQAMSYLKEIEK